MEHIVKPMPAEMKAQLLLQRRMQETNELIREELKGKKKSVPSEPFPEKRTLKLPEGYTGTDLKKALSLKHKYKIYRGR